jgi:hypothetical protein
MNHFDLNNSAASPTVVPETAIPPSAAETTVCSPAAEHENNKPSRILSARERQLAGLRPPFKPGEVHNPLGRPKGSRNKLAEYMVRDFCESSEKHGAQAIETLRKKKPVDYVRIASQLIPKEYLLKDQTAEGMSDDQLGAVIDRMKQIIAQHEQNIVDVTPVDPGR